MKESAHGLSLCERVVQRHGSPCLFNVHGNTLLPQELQSLGTCLKNQIHPSTQDDNLAPAFEQLLYVFRLDTGPMTGAGLVPVPLTSATWIELDVLLCPKAVDLDPAPRNVSDVWRQFGFLGHRGSCRLRRAALSGRNVESQSTAR